MDQLGFNWKNYHHRIYQIYHGFIALTLVPFALLFLEWDSGVKSLEMDYSGFTLLLSLLLLFIVGYTSWYVWKGRKINLLLHEKATLYEKLMEFRKRNTYKYLLLAAGGLTSVFAMWLLPSFVFVIGYFAVLIQYSFLRPSEDKIVRDLGLSKNDREVLHDNT